MDSGLQNNSKSLFCGYPTPTSFLCLSRLLKELEELSEGVEHEDWDEEDKGKVDNIDGFVDEIEELSDSEHWELLKSIRSIRLALVKVRNGLLVCTLSSADFENTNRSASSHSS